MKVAIIGTRDAAGFKSEQITEHLPKECSVIISGGAVGIDTAAEHYAKEHSIPFRKILPDYSMFGKRAPLVRDTQIVKEADLVLAFWDMKSRGTSFTIAECIRLGVAVQIIKI